MPQIKRRHLEVIDGHDGSRFRIGILGDCLLMDRFKMQAMAWVLGRLWGWCVLAVLVEMSF